MKKKLGFGILGTAAIARESMIPAMQESRYCEVVAVASRNAGKARTTAETFGIIKYYDHYEALLTDPEVEAVYIPLPNHLHASWTTKALQAGKHVLCEKPLTPSLNETLRLLEEIREYPDKKVMEGFMYRFHPQWQRAKTMVREGQIGALRSVMSVFTFFDDDPSTIVNHREFGGGSLRDIGCYNLSLSRFLFEDEPEAVNGSVEYDPELGVDTLASGVLTFQEGTSAFTCSIRLEDYQRVWILGTEGKIEIEWPFNPPRGRETLLFYTHHGRTEPIVVPPADHYALMADAFARAVMEDRPVPFSLDDAVDNMRVLEAVIESARTGATIRTK
jgi:predicted dehydrogenase